MFVYVCVFVGMLGASEPDGKFHYKNSHIVRNDNVTVCEICHSVDCLEMEQLRCEYYLEADKLIPETVREAVINTEINAKADDMMQSLLERAVALTSECIPLVSSYTDCHKENICTGCRSCTCDVTGRWDCDIVQKCRADPILDINHRVLLKVIKNLRSSDHSNRLKRSVKDELNVLETKISYEDVSKWLFDDQPQLIDQSQQTTSSNKNQQKDTQIEVLTKAPLIIEQNIQDNKTTAPTNYMDNDYLAFDEMLNNIAVDINNYTTKKPIPDESNDTFFDYTLFDEYSNSTNGLKAKDESLETNNTLVVGSSDSTTPKMEQVTEVVTSLFESPKGTNIAADNHMKDYMDVYEKNNYIDPANDIEINAINIMKRDVVTQNNSIIQNLNTNEDDINTSGTVVLMNDVLVPINNLINVKQKELEDLLRISENLIKFMKFNKTENVDANAKVHDNETETNSSFTIYKLDIVQEFDDAYDLRRTNNNILQQILYKLKIDIYDVIKDIINIQKLTNLNHLPQDLKVLIRAMKTYVLGQKNYSRKGNMEKGIYFRRQWRDENTQNSNTIIDDFIAIFEVVDRNKPDSDALAPLSGTSKRILERIIEQNYADKFHESRLSRVPNHNYNLTDDLQSIGVKWHDITKHVTNSTVFNILHAMKLLHLALSCDIEKMYDALALINFARNRRMSTIDGPVGNRIIDKINRSLRTINDKIKLIIKIHNTVFQPNNIPKTFELRKKKDSFFKKIRNILRNSKKDIVSLIKRKVKNHELVKEIARKKLEDDATRRKFTDFEETMKKWQNNLNLTPRDKRSLRDIKHKNILPKYLRGKIYPAVIVKDMTRNNFKRNNNEKSELQSVQ